MQVKQRNQAPPLEVVKTNEAQLRIFDQAAAITAVKVVRVAEGYLLMARVSHKKEDVVVFNKRGTPRAWASLDRLLKYLQEVAPSVKRIDLQLDASATWDQALPAADVDQGRDAPASQAKGP